MKIEMQPIESSNIKAIGYDGPTNTMAVEFKSGGLYHYAGVPPEVHGNFVAAKSAGKYFLENIRHNKDYHASPVANQGKK